VILAVALWISGSDGRWISSGGPFVGFEIRLPPVTFWSDGLGRGCRVMGVQRSSDPPEIVSKCSLIGSSADSAVSLRFRGNLPSLSGRRWGSGKCHRFRNATTTSVIWFVHRFNLCWRPGSERRVVRVRTHLGSSAQYQEPNIVTSLQRWPACGNN
jgi:hypothetical protein